MEQLDKYEYAIAYDLLTFNLRLRDLGTEEFAWYDLFVILNGLDETSRYFRVAYPDQAHWTLENHLLASVLDEVRVANWQRSEGKKRDFPKQMVRPGVEPDDKVERYDVMRLDDYAEWLGGDFASLSSN